MPEPHPDPQRDWWTTARRAPWELWAYVVVSVVFAVLPLVTFQRWIDRDLAGWVGTFLVLGLIVEFVLLRFLLRGSGWAWWIAVVLEVLGVPGAFASGADWWSAVSLATSLAMLALLLNFNVRTWTVLSPEARASEPRLRPLVRGWFLPTFAPETELARVAPSSIDMASRQVDAEPAATWFCVFVDHGDVLAWAVRTDLVVGDATAWARLAETVNRAYWGGTRQAASDVRGRFLDGEELQQAVGELPDTGLFAIDGARSIDLAAARQALATLPSELDGATILQLADVRGRTLRSGIQQLDGIPYAGAAWLAIGRYGDAASEYYLFSCSATFDVETDTLHSSVAEAQAQAAFEYGDRLGWTTPDGQPA